MEGTRLVITHTGTGDLSTSLAMSDYTRGHVGRIGSRPAEEFESPSFAAGAVLWRTNDDGDLEIAVEHRPRYDDWTLPKGKVDPGENFAGTAVREIREETGYEVELGWLVGYVHYPLRKHTKVVYYWTAEAIGGFFEGNEAIDDEVDELRWLSADDARELMTYELDVEVLDAALKLLALGADRRVLLIRHAKAESKSDSPKNDGHRRLAKKGRKQADMLVSQLRGYHPEVLYSARPDRCVHTMAPLADELDLPISVDRVFDDSSVPEKKSAAFAGTEAVRSAAKKAKTVAIASQGRAISRILHDLSADADFQIDDLRIKKSSVWVLHFKGKQLLGADYFASPLAVK